MFEEVAIYDCIYELEIDGVVEMSEVIVVGPVVSIQFSLSDAEDELIPYSRRTILFDI